MKTTKTLESNMTKFDEVKEKVQDLDDDELPCDELRKGVKELKKFIETYPFKKITRRTSKGIITHYDFYEVKGYNKGNEILGPKIGYISKENYKKYEEKIEMLREEANKEEFKIYIKELKIKKQ